MFAGIGGFRSGLSQFGDFFIPVGFCEIDPYTKKAYEAIYAGSIADAEYRSDWAEALIRCMSIEDMTFDNFKLAVDKEFGVCIDYNAPLFDYFHDRDQEVHA